MCVCVCAYVCVCVFVNEETVMRTEVRIII